MDLQTAKTNVMQKIMNVSKSSLLEKIGNILDEEMIIGMSLTDQPFIYYALGIHHCDGPNK